MTENKMIITIDPEFQAYIPALSDDERGQLERNLIADGCRDPLIVWNGILIDGHNRHEICTRLNIPFGVVEKDFANREAALDWMDAHQLGRRNLSPDARKLLLGRRYNRRKADPTANLVQNAPNGQNVHSGENAAEELAKEHGVNERTVRRAGKFAEQVEADADLKAAVEAGQSVASVKKARVQDEAPKSNPAPEPVDPERRKLLRLTPEAAADEIEGLRANLKDEKAKSARLKNERDDLAAKLAEALSGEQGKVIGNLQRQLHQLKGRIAEHQTAAKRWERKAVKAEGRVKELENLPIDMGAL